MKKAEVVTDGGHGLCPAFFWALGALSGRGRSLKKGRGSGTAKLLMLKSLEVDLPICLDPHGLRMGGRTTCYPVLCFQPPSFPGRVGPDLRSHSGQNVHVCTWVPGQLAEGQGWEWEHRSLGKLGVLLRPLATLSPDTGAGGQLCHGPGTQLLLQPHHFQPKPMVGQGQKPHPLPVPGLRLGGAAVSGLADCRAGNDHLPHLCEWGLGTLGYTRYPVPCEVTNLSLS